MDICCQTNHYHIIEDDFVKRIVEARKIYIIKWTRGYCCYSWNYEVVIVCVSEMNTLIDVHQ